MNISSLLVAVTAALLLGACAEMKWTKPGANAATVSRELDDCRATALRRGTAIQPAAAPSAEPQLPIDRGASSAGNRSVAGSSNERFVAEHEQVRACMTERGYQLQRTQ